MRTRTRIHIRLDPPRSLFNQWTFDHPRKVTIGFHPRSSVWIFDPKSDHQRTLLERRGKEIRLRADQDLPGHVRLGGQDISLAALRESGLLKSDRRGDYVALREKTEGSVTVGETKVHFWITPSTDDPEFPLHPQIFHILKGLQKEWVLMLILSFFLHGILGWIYFRMPKWHSLPIDEVDQRVTRFILPQERYAEIAIERKRRPRKKVRRTKRLDHSALKETKVGGLLAAVESKRPGAKASPFQNLFTSNTIGGDLDKILGGKNLDDALAQQLKSGGAGNQMGLGAPDTVEIGSLRQGDYSSDELDQSVKGPAFARLSSNALNVQGNLDRDKLASIVNGNVGQLQDCYERGLTRKPNLQGKVVVGVLIGMDGRPSRVKIDETTMRDRGVERCITQRISAWTFPKPRGAPTHVRFPFIFSGATRG